jgi:hypothetical protein
LELSDLADQLLVLGRQGLGLRLVLGLQLLVVGQGRLLAGDGRVQLLLLRLLLLQQRSLLVSLSLAWWRCGRPAA